MVSSFVSSFTLCLVPYALFNFDLSMRLFFIHAFSGLVRRALPLFARPKSNGIYEHHSPGNSQ
jgi:hypothetical protein